MTADLFHRYPVTEHERRFARLEIARHLGPCDVAIHMRRSS